MNGESSIKNSHGKCVGTYSHLDLREEHRLVVDFADGVVLPPLLGLGVPLAVGLIRLPFLLSIMKYLNGSGNVYVFRDHNRI